MAVGTANVLVASVLVLVLVVVAAVEVAVEPDGSTLRVDAHSGAAPQVTPNGKKYKIGGRWLTGNNIVIERVLKNAGYVETTEDDWHYLYYTGVPNKVPVNPDCLRDDQIVNHVLHVGEMTRKDFLANNIDYQKRRFGEAYEFHPTTFVLPQDMKGFTVAHQYRKKLFDQNKKSPEERMLWILKPPAEAQARGIRLVQDPSEITEKDEKDGAIVQEYIQNPYLINGYKWHARVWVLVTSFEPLKIFVYRDGYCVFSTEKFTTANPNLTAHITNYATNKNHENYFLAAGDEDNIGNTWSLRAIFEHLAREGVDIDNIWEQFDDIIVKTVIAAAHKLYGQCAGGGYCYEFIGFDLFLDANLRVWLLEVNKDPAMGFSCAFEERLKEAVTRDTFRLVGALPLAEDVATRIETRLVKELLQLRDGDVVSDTLLERILWLKNSESFKQVLKLEKEIHISETEGNRFALLYPTHQSQKRYLGYLVAARVADEHLAQHMATREPTPNKRRT
eukprot:gnl/Spiro4/13044_TR6917_c0_g1_i1.p1 gnl/Spiro4/13044_TR6917_c0_g1~~gnl/Spiro4/13044_TR6917_c0_g1_i1.p1  ORF type:complete len:504 (+),score=170.38 gnl/Spiro4/13044_TR6917_c0_g1_i1:81-1592(+)